MADRKLRKIDMTPFDMRRRPAKQYPFLLPLIWGGAYLMTRQFGLKIEKENMKGVKPPYLIIGMHQGFSDYYIGPLAVFPRRAMYVSDMEGFAAFGKWLYRGLGCIGKRRYVPEVMVLSHMKYALAKGQSVFVYPESRHSNVGTTAYIPKNLGRLCKMMKAPVIVLSEHGSYLANPFWDEEHTRKVPIKVKMTCLYDQAALEQASETEIQQAVEQALAYNEYAYQKENKIKISYKNRAEGLHKPLYQCLSCKEKYEMDSKTDQLLCKHCGAKWWLTEYGELKAVNKEQPEIAIPDWYEWEREQAIKDFKNKSFQVTIEALPNEKGFVPLGRGILYLDESAFTLQFEGQSRENLIFKHSARESVQTEYNYKGKGMCIVLSDADCCYYLYSENKEFQPTELQFIGEYLFQNQMQKQ